MKKILMLGSGELGKELTISLKRIGCYVITCDAYENAPAMQVSDRSEVFNMLDKNKLTKIIINLKFWMMLFENKRLSSLFNLKFKIVHVIQKTDTDIK